MEPQRLDLGPNRWMAAGGRAFVHVRIWKRWLVWVTAASVRDFTLTRRFFFSEPYWFGPYLILNFIMACLLVLGMYAGGTNGVSDILTLGLFFVTALLIAVRFVWRRGKVSYYFDDPYIGTVSPVDFTDGESSRPELGAFTRHLQTLKAAAGSGLRRIRYFFVLPWWAGLILAPLAALAMVGLWVLLFGSTYWQVVLVVSAALMLLAFMLSAGPSLLAHPTLRLVQQHLLYGDVEAARELLKTSLSAKPTHAHGTRLLTIAEVMRCNLELAEDLVLENSTPGLYQPSRFRRITDYRLWENRHGGRQE